MKIECPGCHSVQDVREEAICESCRSPLPPVDSVTAAPGQPQAPTTRISRSQLVAMLEDARLIGTTSGPAARASPSVQAPPAHATSPGAAVGFEILERTEVHRGDSERSRGAWLRSRSRFVFGAAGVVLGLAGGGTAAVVLRPGPAPMPPPAASASQPPVEAGASSAVATTVTSTPHVKTWAVLKPSTPPRFSKRAVGLLDPAKNGCLAVTTKHAADVYFKEIRVATAPSRCLELPAGWQTIGLETPDLGVSGQLRVQIRAGETTLVTVEM